MAEEGGGRESRYFTIDPKKWLKTIQNAITNGRCVIVENLGADINAALDPVLSREIYKKGRN